MSDREADTAMADSHAMGAVRAATRDGIEQLAVSGAWRAGGGLVAGVRGLGNRVMDLFVAVVFLMFAGRARRDALYADADRAAEEIRANWAPLAQASPRWQVDPVVQERILQQILATSRPAPSPLTSARRWGSLVAALAVAVVLAVGAVVVVGGGDPVPVPRSWPASSPSMTAAPGASATAGALPSSAGVGGSPACPVPPAGVRPPVDVLLRVPGQPSVPMTMVYSHRDAEGIQVWYAYGPSGQVTVPGTRVTTGLFPPLTTMQVQTDPLPDGHSRFRPLPCQPTTNPDQVSAPAGADAARGKDNLR